MLTAKATSITLPDLPYPIDALEPFISSATLELHHGKHHKAYVDNMNRLIKGTDLEGEELLEVIERSAGDHFQVGIYNNAAQVFNHSFYFKSMRPGGGGEPTGEIAKRLKEDFGGYKEFVEAFISAATTLFGSGWVWLVLHDEKLDIVKTSNADTPILHGNRPLLAIDVWEHAYYIDYQNRRPEYVKAWVEKLIDWDFVNENLG